MRTTDNSSLNDRMTRGLVGRTRRQMARFSREEDGVMLFLVIMLLLIMMMVGGMGVDFMRHEMTRAKIQSTLDRAILAAADMDQELDPAAVVADYFSKSGMAGFLSDVQVDDGPSHRIVTATASTNMKTQFLGSLGFTNINVPASGRAEESLGDAEVSLVLDISGSMGDNQRMSRLRTAAKEFVDTVILDDTMGAVSISVVPYTSQVNVGAAIFDRLNIARLHGYSSCVNFADEDFDTTAIPTTQAFTQGEHFDLYGNSHPVQNPGCPMRSYEEVLPFNQNRSELKTMIGSLNDRANTAIHLGMKWGVGLLDPSLRPVIADMAANALIDADFAGRPADYGSGALKTVILMTDGENVSTVRLRDGAYASPSQRYHWHRNALVDWVDDHASGMNDEFYYIRSTGSQADGLLDRICDAAKANGIIVWSVGFEVSNHGADVMASCASSPSHFFRVEGVQISEAFRSIARQLSKLKLTQ